jgi:hypothetical protein
MENLKALTPTELLVLINKTNDNHENIKKEILSHLDIIKEHEDIIDNSLLPELNNLENNYVLLIEELNKKSK